jgi:hypothetical protein
MEDPVAIVKVGRDRVWMDFDDLPVFVAPRAAALLQPGWMLNGVDARRTTSGWVLTGSGFLYPAYVAWRSRCRWLAMNRRVRGHGVLGVLQRDAGSGLPRVRGAYESPGMGPAHPPLAVVENSALVLRPARSASRACHRCGSPCEGIRAPARAARRGCCGNAAARTSTALGRPRSR